MELTFVRVFVKDKGVKDVKVQGQKVKVFVVFVDLRDRSRTSRTIDGKDPVDTGVNK